MKYVNDINVDMKFEPYMYALFDTMIDPIVDDICYLRTIRFVGYGKIWEELYI